MFTKPLTRAPWYILIKSFFVAIGLSYLHDLSATFLKRLKLLWGEFACQKRIAAGTDSTLKCKGTKQKKKVNFNVQTKQQLCTCITRFDTFRCILCTQFRTQTTRYFPNIQPSPEGEVNSSRYRFGKYWYYCPQSPLFVSNSAERLCGRDIKYWAYVLRPSPPLSV